MIKLVFKIRGISVGHVPVVDLDGAGSNNDVHRLSKLGQISHCPRKCQEYGFYHIFVKFTRGSNRNWVTVDHIKAFLVNRMLAFRFCYLLLSGVSQQQLL